MNTLSARGGSVTPPRLQKLELTKKEDDAFTVTEVKKYKSQYHTAKVRGEPASWQVSTYVSPAGPAPPPGRQHISWRGWSRNRLRTADPRLAHTPLAPRLDRTSACWPMRRNRGWPNRWWGTPEKPAGRMSGLIFIYAPRHSNELIDTGAQNRHTTGLRSIWHLSGMVTCQLLPWCFKINWSRISGFSSCWGWRAVYARFF